MTSCYIVAEIGINWNGDDDMLRDLIDAAAFAKANAVKFQVGDPDEYVAPDQRDALRETPWGTLRYADYRKRLELSDAQLTQAAKQARARRLDLIVSPLDALTIARLEHLDIRCDAYKVASPKVVDDGFLHVLNHVGRPVILSTGMSTLEEIDHAIQTLSDVPELAILHCVSKYPCPPAELNLSMIPVLTRRYPQHRIGYSGHEVGLSTSELAASLGAQIIERHITLDRSLWGSDQAASLEPEAFRSMVSHIHTNAVAMGDGIKRIDPSLPNWAKFRHVTTVYGSNTVPG